MKRIFLSLAAGFLLMEILLCGTACTDGNGGGEDTTSSSSETTVTETDAVCDHFDGNGDNLCDICNAVIDEVVNVTITVKDKEGDNAPMSGIGITVLSDSGTVASGVTDNSGAISATLLPGRYTVRLENAPEGWIIEGSGSYVEISADNKELVYWAVDNNPDGSQKKPYYAGVGDVDTVFPANQTYHFYTRGSAKYLVINNENVKVTYEGREYLPENGTVRVYLNEAEDTNTTTLFAITNTADTENTVKVELEAIPGTFELPFDATLGEAVTAEVESGMTVYYSVKADKAGYLMLDCPTPDNYIMMQNKTTSRVTGYTSGGRYIFLSANAGDEIVIYVASNASAKASIQFTLTMQDGTEESPLMLSQSTSVKLDANKAGVGETLVFEYEGDDKTLVIELYRVVTLNVNGEAVVATDGRYSVAIKDGDIITMTNTSGAGIDIPVTIK